MANQTVSEMDKRLQNLDLDALQDAICSHAKTVKAIKNLATRKTEEEDLPVAIDDFETIMGIIDAGIQDIWDQLP